MAKLDSLRSFAQSKAILLTFALMTVLSLGLIAYALKCGTPLKYTDERQYVELARAVREGKGFVLAGHPTAFRPPTWPLLIAGFLLLGIPESMLSAVPAMAMVAAAFVVSGVGVKLAGRWGALAGVAVLVYPLNVYVAVLMYPQALATFLLAMLILISVVVADRALNDGRAPKALCAVAGLVAAAMALSVPTLAFTAAVMLMWLVYTARGHRLGAFWGVATFAVVIGAWTIRNLLVLGAPVMLSTSSGANLLIGNNPTATASSGVAVDIGAASAATSGMTEIQADAYLRQQALHWILGHPGDAIALYLAKTLNYFSPYNQPVDASAGTGMQRFVAYAAFGTLVVLVVARLILRRVQPLRSVENLFFSVWVVNALVMAVFFTRTRFRQPLDTLLLIEAGVACAVLIAASARRRSPNSTG